MKAFIDRFASLRVTVILLVVSWSPSPRGRSSSPCAAPRPPAGDLPARPGSTASSPSSRSTSPARWSSAGRGARWRIGFAITHLSMLVILAGALATELVQGRGPAADLGGEEATAVIVAPRAGSGAAGGGDPAVRGAPRRLRDRLLPGHAPAGDVPQPGHVLRRRRDGRTPAAIEMNQRAAYGGYTFFQSSYRRSHGGREMTILSVSKDPGEPIVFLGYYGLVARHDHGLRHPPHPAERSAARCRRPRRRRFSPCSPLAPAGAQAGADPCRTPPTSRRCARLPVQHDGRVMPLDTLAREAVWNVTGKRSVLGSRPDGHGSRAGPSTRRPGSTSRSWP